MSELGNYIYVGTGRNILVNIIRSIEPATQLPALINPGPIDNLAEIWRYRKDGAFPWERVYKAPVGSGITGFRYMLETSPIGGGPSLFAATFGQRVQILKSTNGINWFILPDTVLQGTSSRAMVVQAGRIYVATIDEANPSPTPQLYSSRDPEFFPWQPVIDPTAPGFIPSQNPTGAISNMIVFNNRIYLGTSTPNGAQVWRTNGPEPRLNDWTLIVDNGFGDPANVYTLAMGIFKDYLYVSGTKRLPLSWLVPRGCDIIRIDKQDKWQVVVGGSLLPPLTPLDGQLRSLSGLRSGFNNPFNVYGWQIEEFQGKLLISTFDDSSNMQVILDTLLANRAALNQLIGEATTNLLIGIYTAIVEILRAIKYPIVFDLYISNDGVHFNYVFLNGLCNPNNYGGRILYVDSRERLYLGTANPFQGCEVWKSFDINKCSSKGCDESHYGGLAQIRDIINENFSILSANMPIVQQFIPQTLYHKFINDNGL